MAEPTIDVCIVVYDVDRPLFLKTLAAAEVQPEVRVVRVHVNGGADVLAWVHEQLHLFDIQVVVTASDNVGFAAGQNLLIAAGFDSGASHCLVLNPDLVLTPTAVRELATVSSGLGDVHLVSGTLLLQSRGAGQGVDPAVIDSTGITWTSSGRHLDRDQGQPLTASDRALELVPGLTGALTLVPRAAWARITSTSGEFYDEDFFAYREDAELGVRARWLGVGSVVTPTVVGTHFRGSPGTTRANPVTNRLGVRNRFLIASKLGLAGRPGGLFASIVRDVVAVAWVLVGERTSRPALSQAWRLRPTMRAKRTVIRRTTRAPLVGAADDEIRTWRHRCVTRLEGSLESESAIVVRSTTRPPTAVRDELAGLAGTHSVVLVADGWLPDGADFDPRVCVLSTPIRLGAPSALNIGLARVLESGAQAIGLLSDPTSWSQITRLASGLTHMAGRGRGALDPGPSPSPAIRTATSLREGCLFTRDAFEAVGLLDESLPYAGAAVEFERRLERAGLRRFVASREREARQPQAPGADVVDEGSPSPMWGDRGDYFVARNVALLVRAHGIRDPFWAGRLLWSAARRPIVSDERAGSRARETARGLADAVLGRRGPDPASYTFGVSLSPTVEQQPVTPRSSRDHLSARGCE